MVKVERVGEGKEGETEGKLEELEIVNEEEEEDADDCIVSGETLEGKVEVNKEFERRAARDRVTLFLDPGGRPSGLRSLTRGGTLQEVEFKLEGKTSNSIGSVEEAEEAVEEREGDRFEEQKRSGVRRMPPMDEASEVADE